MSDYADKQWLLLDKNFIYNNALKNKLGFPRYSFSNHLFFLCGDTECVSLGGVMSAYKTSNRFRNFRTVSSDMMADLEKNERAWVYEYQQMDVVRGAKDKVMKEFNEVIKNDKSLERATFRCQCIPLLIGENFESEISKCVNNKCHVHYNKMDHDSSDEIAEKVINDLKSKNVSVLGGQKICVFGATKEYFKEIEIELKKKGIDVVGIFAPNLSGIEKIFEANLWVFIKNNDYDNFYKNLIKKNSNIKHVFLDAPFGIKRFKIFILEIIVRLGLSSDIINESMKEFIRLDKDLEKVIKRTKNYKLLFFADNDALNVLGDPEKFLRAIPVLELLLELGFQIKIAIFVDDDNIGEIKKTMRFLKKYQKIIEMEFCGTYNRYLQNMSDEAVDCVYSGLNIDPRIFSANKNFFSVAILSLGPNSALKWAESILKKCERGKIFPEINNKNIPIFIEA